MSQLMDEIGVTVRRVPFREAPGNRPAAGRAHWFRRAGRPFWRDSADCVPGRERSRCPAVAKQNNAFMPGLHAGPAYRFAPLGWVAAGPRLGHTPAAGGILPSATSAESQ
ncbi:hypothetical protein FsymDg_1545 [Candidatus Protofrankia datiscae]|uniref:Uncharacterized protein n=1 Tax=Candidatus Protofrankia datiscae TaxID=2716812 RepID=F8B3R0_9ACTN|nr:hypothetical protein FsymDg_1545 [Candidatus Protofrankia datiscae]